MNARGPDRAEVIGALAAGCVLAVAMNWPLVLHLGSRLPPANINDPLVQAWQIAWGGHALLHQPLDFFQSNIFWPLRNSFAFTEALAGYAPLGTIGSGPHAAVARYDLVFLFTHALAFFGTYLLARELGVGRAGGAVAGAAFAFSPWRLSQANHLHVLSTGGIPLSLFLLLRGYRRGQPMAVLAGWLVAAWQFSLGFTTGLQLAYLLLFIGAIAVVVWWRRGRPAPERSVTLATAAGLVVFATVAVWLALPYTQVLRDHPEAHRTLKEVAFWSPPVHSFLVASPQDLVWSGATASVRSRTPLWPEHSLFPGALTLALAVLGVGASAYSPRLRLGLAAGVLVVAALSLGVRTGSHGVFFPYRALYEFAPGWGGVRTPGRLMNLTTLGLALLAAGGADRVVAAVRERVARRHMVLAGRAAALALVFVLLAEGSAFRVGEHGSGLLAGPLTVRVPAEPRGEQDAQPPLLHLPLNTPDSRKWILWSTDDFPDMVNGNASFIPTFFEELYDPMSGFPDRTSARLLQDLGVRTVVLHPGDTEGTAWQRWKRRSMAGLPLRREDRGGVVLFHVRGARAVSERVPTGLPVR